MSKKYSILIIYLFSSIISFGQINTEDASVNHSTQTANYKPNKVGIVNVKDSIFMLKGRGGNIGVSIGEDGILIIDSQFPDASADIIERVNSLSKRSIKLLVNTHHHGDHVGGNSNLAAEGALVFSHQNARRRMAEPYTKKFKKEHQRKIDSIVKSQGAKITTDENIKNATRDAEKIVGSLEDNFDIPTGTLSQVSFSKDLTLNFNGERIIIVHLPTAHTDGDVILYFTESNVMHTGDAFVSKTYPFIDSENSGSLKGYISGLTKIMGMINTETRVIPGHGPVASKADVSYTYNMLRFLKDKIALNVLQKKTEDQVVAMTDLTKEYDDKGFGDGFISTEKLIRTMYKEISKNYKD